MKSKISYFIPVLVIAFTNSIFKRDDGKLEFKGKIGTNLMEWPETIKASEGTPGKGFGMLKKSEYLLQMKTVFISPVL